MHQPPRLRRVPVDADARAKPEDVLQGAATCHYWISSGTGVMEKPKSPAVVESEFAVAFQNTGAP